jgi:hypothetical protein
MLQNQFHLLNKISKFLVGPNVSREETEEHFV